MNKTEKPTILACLNIDKKDKIIEKMNISFNTKYIERVATDASGNAIANALNHGRSITILQGNSIVEVHPDGRTETIKKLEKTSVIPKKSLSFMKKRMRVFAGPNGSGKSTLLNQFIDEKSNLINLDRHINPDYLNSIDILDFDKYGLVANENDFRCSILQSSFYKDCNFYFKDIIIINNCFVIPNKNSYIGSMLADYMRECYVKSNERLFSFELFFHIHQK
jgi:hypothetical protein